MQIQTLIRRVPTINAVSALQVSPKHTPLYWWCPQHAGTVDSIDSMHGYTDMHAHVHTPIQLQSAHLLTDDAHDAPGIVDNRHASDLSQAGDDAFQGVARRTLDQPPLVGTHDLGHTTCTTNIGHRWSMPTG
eukprot:1161216-Pelagomonas_calceolata.AAC.6